MQMLIDVLVLAALAYVAIDAVRSFTRAAGSLWQRLLAVGKQSSTLLWQRFVVLVAGLADALAWAADLLGEPSVASALQAHLKPSTVAAVMVAVAIVSELARRRTLRR
ncbi:MAG TPA: hypothetical protein VGF60_04580 [Xanthobacteraceae bacterium]